MSVPTVAIEGRDQVLQLRRDLLKIPTNLRKEIRPALREAAENVKRGAQGNSHWSSRIPAAMRIRVSFAQNRPGVFIVVDKGKAPHARPYEGIIVGSFRHPVFGDRDVWVTQQTRPYLVPALESNEGETFTLIRSTVDEVMAKLGL